MGVALYHKNVFLKGERFEDQSTTDDWAAQASGYGRPRRRGDMICPFKSVMDEAEGKVHYLHLNSTGDGRMEGGHLFCLITKLFSYHALVVRSSAYVVFSIVLHVHTWRFYA